MQRVGQLDPELAVAAVRRNLDAPFVERAARLDVRGRDRHRPVLVVGLRPDNLELVLAVFGLETCVQDNRRLSRGERLVVLPRPSVFEDLIAFLIYTLQLFTSITIVVRYGPTNYASASMRQKEFQLAAQKMQ